MTHDARLARRRQRGQTAAEFTFVGVLFFALLGGLIEMTYVFRAKSVLNMATFDAARSGAMHNALVAPMETTLQNDMAALYMQTDASQAGLAAAIARTQALYNSMKTLSAGLPITPLTIISPTLDVYNKFSQPQMIRLADQSTESLVNVMPNDNLQWRARTVSTTIANGSTATINLQDANLLKIRVYWCQHLIVPALDYIVHGIANINPSPQQEMCNALGNSDLNYYLAIESDAVIQMQSPVYYDGTNLH
jgi:Flp pilus assembly protein TadG